MPRRALVLPSALVALIALASACDPPPSLAPTISNLTVMPTALRAGESLTVDVRFRDEDEDTVFGKAEVSIRRKTEQIGMTYNLPLNGTDKAAAGNVKLSIKLPVGALPGAYEVSVTLIDAVERRSNALVADFNVIE